MMMFRADWNLWDGGLREAEREEGEIQIQIARLRREEAQRTLRADLQMALQTVRSAQVRVTLGEAQVGLAEESLRQMTKAYRLGTVSQSEVIDSEDQVSVSRLQLLQSELDRDLALARLAHLRPMAEEGR